MTTSAAAGRALSVRRRIGGMSNARAARRETASLTGFARGIGERLSTADHDAWDLAPSRGPQKAWTYVQHQALDPPPQGWKLHVSATTWNAERILAAVLQILLAEPTSFKVAADEEVLRRLNRGEYGLSQIGKFVTVYPVDLDQARRLGSAMSEATAGQRGPRVPTDRRFSAEGLVSYRYGDFCGQELQLPTGEVVPAIARPDGQLVVDARETWYAPPDWVEDPFDPPAETIVRPGAVVEDCLVVADLAFMARGPTYLAADLECGTRCVLKGALAGAGLKRDGTDAQDDLRREFGVLQQLAQFGWAPRPDRLIVSGEVLFLKMEDIAGETLAQHLAHAAAWGRLPAEARLVDWARQILAMLQALHESGWLHGDLKTANLILGAGGRLRLIDFGMSHPLPAPEADRLGTRGYRPPIGAAIAGDGVARDLYAVGCILYSAATGVDPTMTREGSDLLDRPIGQLNPEISPEFATFVASLLSADGGPRPATARAACGWLETGVGGEAAGELHSRTAIAPPSLDWLRSALHDLGDGLCADLEQSFASDEGAWVSTHDLATGRYRDLNLGSAGALMGLGEIAAATRDRRHLAWLARAADAFKDPPETGRTAGLYAGESGMGLALLRAGLVLGDERLTAAAAERSHWVAGQPLTSPDLFVGAAGRLRFHLFVWDATGDDAHLTHALACGDAIGAAALPCEAGGACWPIPDGHGHMSGQSYFGFAHGAAGIGDALLDLCEASGDGRYGRLAARAATWLVRHARPALRDGSGLNWPLSPEGPSHGAFWCHGAAGVSLFLQHAADAGVARVGGLVPRAARTVAQATRWAGPTACHGLAGNVEVLLDLHEATGEPVYLADAQALGCLLAAQAQKRDGRWIWPSESPATISPDYMVGYAGLASPLIRLAAAPTPGPRQLSRASFRRLAQVHGGQAAGRAQPSRP